MGKKSKLSKPKAAPKSPSLAAPPLAPQVLEKAAQGWLQSSGTAGPAHRPARSASDHRLAEALTETLRELRAEISDLRSRLDRLESK